ncbi:MAG: type II secretion system F family protein [Nocardioides sp.]
MATDSPGAERTAIMRGAAAATGAVGAAVFVGGDLGPPLGALAGVAVWVVVGRMEPSQARRRRERLESDLPHAVDLLAACLAGGQAPGPSVEQVARAVGGPVGQELGLASARLRLGVDPIGVWRDLSRHPQLGTLGRCVARAMDSGASVADAMARLAEDLRHETRSRMEGKARAVGVKAALPLGLCLLPAFVLTGVVPVVVGSLGSLLRP